MITDHDGENADPGRLPRFQLARAQTRFLHRATQFLLPLAFSLLIAGWLVAILVPDSIWIPLFYNNAAGLFVLTAGLRSALAVAGWRRDAIAQPTETPAAPPAAENGEKPEGFDIGQWFSDRLGAVARVAVRTIGAEPLEIAGLALLALLAVYAGWNLALPADDPGTAASAAGGLALAAAFGLLVLERRFAGASTGEWPEAQRLAHLARVPVLILSVSALCLFASRTGGVWPVRLMVLAGLLPVAIALELIVCGLLGMFRPSERRDEPRMIAVSLLAQLLRWPPPKLAAMLQDELHARTGIDLRQVWAFSFMRRALLPVALCVVLAGWLLSGLREIPMNGRGIYERFGQAEAVLGPGLHAGLPWPLSRIVPVENGVVHELAAVAPLTATGNRTPAPAEGPAPASANRLWDVTHPMDKSQIIASASNDSQNFQLVDLDIRFFYRIGLTDWDALDATYNNADLPGLIRSVAGRVLVHTFASRTLDGVLSAERTALAHAIEVPLQAELDRLHSGAQIVSVVIEAIHPPAGAANAYHGVQAAEIAAQALVVRERGNAAEKANAAETAAAVDRDNAAAKARETLAAADALSARAGAERKAYDEAGPAFLQERYYEELRKGLPQADVLILDHRIGGGEAPTIDLRDFTPPVDAALPARGGSDVTSPTGGRNEAQP